MFRSSSAGGVPRRTSLTLGSFISGVLAVATVAVLMVHGAATAYAAPNVTCGQTITASITLNTNLFCTSGNALQIGAASVTVNLGGHSIVGGDQGTIGIYNPNLDNVTITGGRVTDFQWGVRYDGGANGVVQGMRLGSNGDGVSILGGSATVTNNNAYANNRGIVFLASGTVNTNQVSGSGDTGIWINGTSVVVRGNRSVSNTRYGFLVQQSLAVTMNKNLANSNGIDGIFVPDDFQLQATLADNTANFNANLGVNAGFGDVTDGGGNLARDNGNAAQCQTVACT
jgi:hypothetical protein